MCICGAHVDHRAAGYDTAFAGEWALSRVPSDGGAAALQMFGFDEWLTPGLTAGDATSDGVAAVAGEARAWLTSRTQGSGGDDGAAAKPVFLVVVLGTCIWQAPRWRGASEAAGPSRPASAAVVPETQCQEQWRELCGKLFLPDESDDDGRVLRWHDAGDADALQQAVDSALRLVQGSVPDDGLVSYPHRRVATTNATGKG